MQQNRLGYLAVGKQHQNFWTNNPHPYPLMIQICHSWASLSLQECGSHNNYQECCEAIKKDV